MSIAASESMSVQASMMLPRFTRLPSLQQEAPLLPAWCRGRYRAGEPFTDALQGRDGVDPLGVPPMKLHVQLKKDNWDIWARLTRGGKQFGWAPESIARQPYGYGDNLWYDRWKWAGYSGIRRPNFYAYLQATGYIGYKRELTETIDVDAAFSYQSTTNVQERESRYGQNYREDNYYAKAIFKWQPNDQHKLAIGFEYLLNDLGLRGWNGLGYKCLNFAAVGVGTEPRL